MDFRGTLGSASFNVAPGIKVSAHWKPNGRSSKIAWPIGVMLVTEPVDFIF